MKVKNKKYKLNWAFEKELRSDFIAGYCTSQTSQSDVFWASMGLQCAIWDVGRIYDVRNRAFRYIFEQPKPDVSRRPWVVISGSPSAVLEDELQFERMRTPPLWRRIGTRAHVFPSYRW